MIDSIATAPRQAWPGLCVLLALLSFNAQLQAQEFSADLVRTRPGAALIPAGRLMVRDGDVRIETPELPDGFFLIDGGKPAAYFVRPAMHLFMDAKQSSRLTRWFVPVDPDDPCRQWQAMRQVAGEAQPDDMRCERVGEDMIDGRRMIAYRAIADGSERFVGWIDPTHGFPMRIDSRDGDIIDAKNIQDTPQPASLLQVPQGFRKFDPEALIQRVKQSDAWVAPPE
jgi:hypothetical protein